MTKQKWIRTTLRKLSKDLSDAGHRVSSNTVARLLKDLGFSLKANQRKQGRLGCPERDQQFKYIASQNNDLFTPGGPLSVLIQRRRN